MMESMDKDIDSKIVWHVRSVLWLVDEIEICYLYL
jgi:hypothetical protein